MGDEEKKNVVGKIKPKKVKARRRADGTVEIIEEVSSQACSQTGATDALGELSFGDRDLLLEELAGGEDLFTDKSLSESK